MNTIENISSKNLKTIPYDTPIFTAQQIMTESRVRHLPVINERSQIVGLLSARDMPRSAAIRELPVEYFMSTPVIYIYKTANLRTAALKMLEEKISSILIVDENQMAIGIVTTDDLLWYLAHQLQEDAKHQQPVLNAMAQKTIAEVSHFLSNIGL